MKKRKLSKEVQMIRKFKKFLSDNNALQEFYRNVRYSNNSIFTKIHSNNIKKLFDKIWVKEWISKAFLWYSTPERFYFWEELNSKWRKELEDYHE